MLCPIQSVLPATEVNIFLLLKKWIEYELLLNSSMATKNDSDLTFYLCSIAPSSGGLLQ